MAKNNKPKTPAAAKAASSRSATGLTPKQQRFVDEYLIDLNATQAAIRAGYSAKTAQEQSSRLLSNVMVAAAIQVAQSRRSEETGITAKRVLQELAVIGFSDVRHYVVDDNGKIDLAEGAPDSAIRAVSSIKHKVRTVDRGDDGVETTHEVEIKLWDKNTALANAGRHLGMFVDKVESTERIIVEANYGPPDG